MTRRPRLLPSPVRRCRTRPAPRHREQLAHGAERLRDTTRGKDVVVLDEGGVIQPDSLVVAPPQRTADFSKARKPGLVLRVSRMRRRAPSTSSTQRRSSSRSPTSGRDVERGALCGRATRGRARERRRRLRRDSITVLLAVGRCDRVVGHDSSSAAQPAARRRRPSSRGEIRDAFHVERHRREAGDVDALAEVLDSATCTAADRARVESRTLASASQSQA